MNQIMLEALNRIAQKLIEMPQDEFEAKLKSHSHGEISLAIKEKIEFFSHLEFMVFSEFNLKHHKYNFAMEDIEYHDKTVCSAANDVTYMMAA